MHKDIYLRWYTVDFILAVLLAGLLIFTHARYDFDLDLVEFLRSWMEKH